jgi:hypothetical protein
MRTGRSLIITPPWWGLFVVPRRAAGAADRQARAIYVACACAGSATPTGMVAQRTALKLALGTRDVFHRARSRTI